MKLLDEELILQKIEDIVKEFGLNITLKTTLSTMKGSVHYHLKQGSLPGLIELTYWPIKKRLWVEIHNNRRSKWNEELIDSLSTRIAEQFSGQVSK